MTGAPLGRLLGDQEMQARLNKVRADMQTADGRRKAARLMDGLLRQAA